MDQVTTAIKSALKPIKALYNKAFDANKYVAGVGLSVLITTALFFVMVILISLGDSGMKEDTSVKLAAVPIQKSLPVCSVVRPVMGCYGKPTKLSPSNQLTISI